VYWEKWIAARHQDIKTRFVRINEYSFLNNELFYWYTYIDVTLITFNKYLFIFIWLFVFCRIQSCYSHIVIRLYTVVIRLLYGCIVIRLFHPRTSSSNVTSNSAAWRGFAYSTHANPQLTHDGTGARDAQWYKLISESGKRNRSNNIPYYDVTRDMGSWVCVSQTLLTLSFASLFIYLYYLRMCVYIFELSMYTCVCMHARVHISAVHREMHYVSIGMYKLAPCATMLYVCDSVVCVMHSLTLRVLLLFVY